MAVLLVSHAPGAARVNYYERHLGDFAKDTAHLSMLELGAYDLLLDRYYSTERGIPADQAYKVARARTRAEREAVDSILAEFFQKVDGIWTKNRCEEEIAKAHRRIVAARENGSKGGRPKDNPPGSSGGTQQEPIGIPSGLSLGSNPLTQTKALQSPDSNLQSPISAVDPLARTSTEVTTRARAAGDTPTPEAEMAIPLRQAGVMVTSIHPILIAWVRDGFTPQQALGAVAIARERKPEGNIPAAYLDTILRNPHVPRINGNGHQSQPFQCQKSPGELEAEAIENGISAGKSDGQIHAEINSQFVSVDDIRRKREEMQHAQH